jgi:hypothetical protein
MEVTKRKGDQEDRDKGGKYDRIHQSENKTFAKTEI